MATRQLTSCTVMEVTLFSLLTVSHVLEYTYGRIDKATFNCNIRTEESIKLHSTVIYVCKIG